MSTFTASELLALDAETLRGLLELAEGDDVVVRAAYLGLDCSVPAHRAAVERAVYAGAPAPQPFSPPVGAAQPGVRSDLTPTEAPPSAPGDGHPTEVTTPENRSQPEPSLPAPDPGAAAALADVLAATAGTGRPFMAGTFALYSDPSGSVVMVTETAAGQRNDVIPRKLVKLALGLMAGKGPGIGMLARMVGRG